MWYQLFCGCGATSISDGIILDNVADYDGGIQDDDDDGVTHDVEC